MENFNLQQDFQLVFLFNLQCFAIMTALQSVDK